MLPNINAACIFYLSYFSIFLQSAHAFVVKKLEMQKFQLGKGGIVKYNIMRNVVKFNWATELMIYIRETLVETWCTKMAS